MKFHYELNTRDISFSGLAIEDLQGNWHNEDVWIEISFPEISTTYSLCGFAQWQNGSTVGIQIDVRSPDMFNTAMNLESL